MATRKRTKSSGARPRTLRLQTAERRAQLIDAALPVFARLGFRGSGTRELARAAGVSEPILYRHFAGKTGLLQAVLLRVEERVVAALDLAVRGAESASDRLKALGLHLPEILEGCRAELRVLNAAALAHDDPDIRAAASRCAGGIGGALARLFRGTGLRRGLNASTAGFLLLELGVGAALLHPLDVPEMTGKAFTDRAVKGLLHGLAR